MSGILFSMPGKRASNEDELKRVEWVVGTVRRVAWVHLPPVTDGAPVVFLWHGHGENPIKPKKEFAFHTLWPEAIIIYPQGLPGPGKRTDLEGRLPGWQYEAGEKQDRDVKFFDAMLKTCLEEWHCNRKQILSVGHSNGARFTYLLWALRGPTLAGVAAIATTADGLLSALKPKPCFHVAGKIDTLVPFADQKETIEQVKKRNGCKGSGIVWEKKAIETVTFYPSREGTPVVEFIFAGGHELPVDAPGLILKFFKQIIRN